jgi:hypothetical protein
MIPAFLVLLALMPVVVAAYFQRYVVLPHFRRENELLNLRRARRVEQALADPASTVWGGSTTKSRYPFLTWVEFLENGTLVVAGTGFSLDKAFQVEARDRRKILRASVRSDGNGIALIVSHGQMFHATFNGGHWNFELVDSPLE